MNFCRNRKQLSLLPSGSHIHCGVGNGGFRDSLLLSMEVNGVSIFFSATIT